MSRELLQVAVGPGGQLFAVDSDGLLWQRTEDGAWLHIPGPPEGDPEGGTPRDWVDRLESQLRRKK